MSSWKPLALNPYGEQVAENTAGQRRVATTLGWRLEHELPAVRACRGRDAQDVRLAMESMAVPVLSASYGHRPDHAFRVWSAPVGTRTEHHFLHSQDPRLAPFRAGVERALGASAWQALVNDRWGTPGLAKWERVRNAPSGTATRGLQWGLARRIVQAGSACKRILEQGLSEPGEAATRWLTPERRVVRARLPAHDSLAPHWLPSAAWTEAPDWSAPKGVRTIGQELEPFDTAIIWATAAATQALGPVSSGWWRWFAHGGRGWVVFDRPGTPAEAALKAQLVARKTPASRFRLREGAQERGVIWEINLDPAGGQRGQDVPWDRFAPEPPVGVPSHVDLAEADEFGRVPYRALSKLPKVEGVAPRRLEAAMHLAFEALAHQIGDVDEVVAEALGIPVEDLGLRLSPEQVDAVGAGLASLEEKRGFIIADETGFGKGRIMAALALIGRRRNHRVLMITENAPLFSDWYRDLDAVAPGAVPVPFLLHQKAVLRNVEGAEVVRNVTPAAMKRVLDEAPAPDAPPLIMTTYAQISRKQSEAKLTWLTQWLEGHSGWVLMDEAHNAAGDSQVNARLEDLLSSAAGAVYASATFVKHEGNLGLYASALPQGRFARALIRRVLKGDSGMLRSTLTQAMARDGRLVRREHPPMAPPEIVWVPNEGATHLASEAFAAAWRALGEAVDVSRSLQVDSEGVWARLGAPLSRAVREFGLWTKVGPVADAVIAAVHAGKKPVIATDSTLEAGLRDALTGANDTPALPKSLNDGEREEDDEALADENSDAGPAKERPTSRPMIRGRQGPPPMWRDRLRRIVDLAIPAEVWMGLPHNDPRGQQLRLKLAEVHSALDRLPDWTLSPLDALRDRLTAAGVRCGELSGRKYRLAMTDGGWRVDDRNDGDRAAQVRAFNSGELDAILISRAGSTGISLHAGRLFKDQRPRELMELDISPNPTHRWQFWGRVRRRDQVCEPTFLSFWLDTPSERRIIERETRKSRQLGSHMGSTRQEPIGWVSPEGEAIVVEWAAEHDLAARRLGVAWPIVGEPTGRVERALARSPMLTQEERAGLIERLARGLDLIQDHAWRRRQDPVSLPSRAIRRMWWWGDLHAPASDGGARLNVRRVDAVERCWAPGRSPELAAVQAAVAQAAQDPQGPDVLERWLNDWKGDAQRGVRSTWGRKEAWRWASAHLGALVNGRAVAYASPETGATIRGVILGLDVLDEQAAARCATTAWALSQIALRVWMVGEPEPFKISLLALSQDPLFKVSAQPASMDWFEVPPAPRIGVVMEGNVLAATDWGRRWNLGRSAMIWDLREGEQVVWALPSHVQFDALHKLPRDLVDVKHALQFFSAHANARLWATLPVGQTLEAITNNGSVLFRFNAAAYQHARETWLDHHADRLMKNVRENLVANADVIDRPVTWAELGRVLGIMENHGWGWRVDPEHMEWYQQTSAHRLWEPSGEKGAKEKTRKSGKKKGSEKDGKFKKSG